MLDYDIIAHALATVSNYTVALGNYTRYPIDFNENPGIIVLTTIRSEPMSTGGYTTSNDAIRSYYNIMNTHCQVDIYSLIQNLLPGHDEPSVYKHAVDVYNYMNSNVFKALLASKQVYKIHTAGGLEFTSEFSVCNDFVLRAYFTIELICKVVHSEQMQKVSCLDLQMHITSESD